MYQKNQLIENADFVLWSFICKTLIVYCKQKVRKWSVGHQQLWKSINEQGNSERIKLYRKYLR